MKIIVEWFYRDARWWQFWRPQSGITGGLLMIAAIVAGCYIVGRLV